MKQRKHCIDMLKNLEGDWISDQAELTNMTVEYFTRLYTEDGSSTEENLVTRCNFPCLLEDALVEIQAEVTKEDVKNAVFSMAPSKSPGPDGIHVAFFQNSWEIIGDTVCNFIIN